MSEPLTLTSLPLFPLGTALFPAGRLPLRVFEVRYLDMIGKCQRAGAPFGVVALAQGSEVRVAGAPPEQLQAVGTLAHIEQLGQPQPGLMTLVARGEHLRAMQTEGLRLAEPEGIETLRVDARDRVPEEKRGRRPVVPPRHGPKLGVDHGCCQHGDQA